MALFPFFRELKDKPVIIVGTGKEAEEKRQKLKPYGPIILSLTEAEFLEKEISGEVICVVAAGEDKKRNREIANVCRSRGILVNAVDDPEYCDFIFPSLIKRGKMSVGICTGGASPAVGMILKQKMEEQIPEHMEEILDWLQAQRPTIRENISDKKSRFAFYHQLAELCMSLDRPLSEKELADLMEIRR